MSRSTEAMVKFSFHWKIEWSDFNNLSTTAISKSFITAYKNIPYYWSVWFFSHLADTEGNKIFLHLHYNDGQLSKSKGLRFGVEFMQLGKTSQKATESGEWEVTRGSGRGYLLNFADRNAKSFQSKYNLSDAEPFYFRITMEIPMSMFNYTMDDPLVDAESTPWLRTLFRQIDEPSKATRSDAKLISKEGKIFHCHKLIIETQSSEFAAMFRHPVAENGIEGEFTFPNLSTNALKMVVEFLYTSKATFQGLSTMAVLEVADAAEQYGMTKLKEACAAWLWKRVVEKPDDIFEIALFAHLHQDLKYVKYRCLDVMAENYEKYSLQEAHVNGKLGGNNNLITELNLYFCRRVEADLASELGARGYGY